MPGTLSDFPYIPLITLGEFIEKLEKIGVEKLELPHAKDIFNKPVYYLKREYRGEEYTAAIFLDLEDDSILTVAEIDSILTRLKIDGKEIGLNYFRL